jgi:7-carboxy-7-deazaguanine synthase
LSTLPIISDPSDAGVGGKALPVSETFFSIQGEGKLAGVPSLFIRASGCNLRCRWCDTPYASWNAEGDPQQVQDLISLSQSRSDVRHVVLTGGEPMIFPQMTELSAALVEAGLHVTIETAGTVVPPGGASFHLISISPKLSNSTPVNDGRDPSGAWARRHESRRINLPVLQRLLDESHAPGRDRQLKFVVSAPTLNKDLEEIDALLAGLHSWEASDVLLMPEGVKPSGQQEIEPIVQACMSRGWRYCPRLHIELWGNVRGR